MFGVGYRWIQNVTLLDCCKRMTKTRVTWETPEHYAIIYIVARSRSVEHIRL
jgi:hypothetical protein